MAPCGNVDQPVEVELLLRRRMRQLLQPFLRQNADDLAGKFAS